MSLTGYNLILLFSIIYSAISASHESKQPNVIFILIDDLGWSDVGCYGHPYHQTPHIDQLAAEGIQFTEAYAAAPICSPTRAALLTGKSPAQLHFEFVTKEDGSPHPDSEPLKQPNYPRDLSLAEQTIVELIDTSYTTGFYGKWHLTQENDRYLGWGNTHGPLQQGFDMGTENRGSHPYGFNESEKASFGDYPEGAFPDDALIDSAIEFLKRNQGNPFLMYLSMYYVHTPVQTRCRWLYEKYKKVLPQHAGDRKIHYAAFVETMDHYVGMVLNELVDLGLTENTIVILTSDNGGHPGYTDNAPLKGNKWNLYEGGIRVPTLIRWPGKIKAGLTIDVPITSVDVLPTIMSLTHSTIPHDVGLVGNDLMPVLLQKSTPATFKNRSLTWHFPFYHPPKDYEGTQPCSAIRKGKYKLIYFYEDQTFELYDLQNDMNEEKNLADSLPELGNAIRTELLEKLAEQKARFPANLIDK